MRQLYHQGTVQQNENGFFLSVEKSENWKFNRDKSKRIVRSSLLLVGIRPTSMTDNEWGVIIKKYILQ